MSMLLVVTPNHMWLADEVYEHLVFQGHQHTSIRALPGMADRTVRIGSAGKTFSLTAWKVHYQPLLLVLLRRNSTCGSTACTIESVLRTRALSALGMCSCHWGNQLPLPLGRAAAATGFGRTRQIRCAVCT